MIPLDAFVRTQIARVAVGLYNLQVGKDTMDWALGALESGDYATVGDLANWVYARDFSSMSNEAMAVRLASNLNITEAQAQADALAYIVSTLDATAADQKGAAVLEMLNLFSGLTTTPAYADAATAFNANVTASVEYSSQFNPDLLITSGSTFTLKEVPMIPGVDGTPPDTVVYWGYNPDGETGNESHPSDGGIPVADLLSFLTTITGLDLAELGLIDDDGIGPFDNVTNLELRLGDVEGNEFNANGNGQLTISFADGSSKNAEVDLGQAYFAFLNDLLFDSAGNSRLFEKEVEGTGTSGTYDEYPAIKLTPAANNGGTVEIGVTTAGDDTIVAGRLELLHGAYIDGGLGYNTLEVDAKGVFAQPLQLLNIQEVRVENLPNVYTYEDGDTIGDDYPYWDDSEIDPAYLNSMLDLSRATSIERLVVTESNFEGFANKGAAGSLTIAGIRNGAVARLEGGFTQDVNLHWGEGQTGPLTVELLLGLVTGSLNFVHNNDSLHLVSLGGGANSFGSEDIGGRLTQLKISGDAALYINGDLDDSFQDATPVTIDASENTGGVDLELSDSQNVTFIGSQGNDVFVVDADENNSGPQNDSSVTIVGGAGDNRYEVDDAYRVTITNGDGNNNYEVEDAAVVSITTGNGNNHFEIEDSADITLVAGDGNNRFEIVSDNSEDTTEPNYALDYPSHVGITVGNGQNDFDIEVDPYIGVLHITAGDGGNTIDALGHEINIDTGNSADVIRVVADKIVINSGGGGDTITIGGTDNDFAEAIGGGSNGSGDYGDGATFQIDTGEGASTIILGLSDDNQSQVFNDFPFYSSITAYPDSYIRGEDITLFVNTVADLRAAELTGITHIVLDDDNVSRASSNQSNTAGDKALLTLLDTQMTQLVTEGVSISVEGSIFNTSAHIKIIVSANLDLTTGPWATLLSSLPASVDFQFEINDGATLKITAQQLHTKVAVGGITITNDGNTDQVSGKVWVTGAGLDFDPFNNSDQVRSTIEGRDLLGGSLGTGEFGFATDADMPADGIQRDEWGFNVLVDRTVNGYNRPADAPSYSRLTIDTDEQDGELGPFATIETFLRIVGESDMEFTPMQGGIDEWGRPIQGGNAIALGVDNGEPTNDYMVDFSSATGAITNLTFAHFQMADAVYGNGTSESPARVNVQIDENEAVASAEAGFVSRGVQTYVATAIEDSAQFWTSRVTQDLQTLGLQGNYEDTITFGNTERGVDFLMEVTYDKFDGYAVGTVVADFARTEADAVFNVVGLQSLPAGEVQKVAGINVTDAESLSISVTGGDTRIESLEGAEVESLTLAADADLTIVSTVMENVESIDASGVAGEVDVTVDPADNFSFVGSEGGSSLTFAADESFTATDDPQIEGDQTSIDGGVGGVVITIGEDAEVDLTEAILTNVTGVVLGDDSELSLTMEQAATIGAENFSIATGDEANLNLSGLDGEPFTLADYADGITVAVLTVADLPEVTLHPDTDLTGIGSLNVHAGTVLTMTAAQFQQLNGAGTIVGIDGTTDFTVHITDLTQADAEFDDSDLPGGTEGLNLSGVTADEATITMAEDIELVVGDSLGGFDVVMGDGMTLTLARIEQADGLEIGGGADTTLKFTDATNGGSIDASGFTVTTLMALNLLVAGQNIDDIFTGLAESVLKVVYNGEGWVIGVNQIVTIDAGTTVPGALAVFKTEDDVEVQTLTLNLLGGTEISGDLNLANTEKEEEGSDLIVTHLRSLTINSSGTDPNLLTGETDNVIAGDITSQPFAPDADSVENNLLDVTINADQSLDIQGSVIFNSVTGDDSITANDDDEAVASLVITGTADVSIGGLDTSDDDVDGLNVVNNSTGTLTITLNDGEIDADDELSFTGSGDIVLVISEGSVIDLSNDDLSGVSAVVLEDDAEIVLTQAQFEAIGSGNISHADFDDTGDEASISIIGLGEDPFDATGLADGIVIGTVTMAAGDITLDPATNLTGVLQIIVPKGGSLTMTAEQYQQLAGSGTITGVDADGNPTSDYEVNITGLSQADVDLDPEDDGTADAGSGFKLGGVTADTITVTTVEDIDFDANTDLNGASISIGGFALGLATEAQADGLVVTGAAGSTVTFMFDIVGPIEAKGYDIDTLRALASSVDGTDVEFVIDNLSSDIELNLYEDPSQLGFVSAINRVVNIEEGVAVPGSVVFNGQDDDREVRTLIINFTGDATDRTEVEDADGNLEGSVIAGDLILDREAEGAGLVASKFQKLTLNSSGVGDSNAITGDITPLAQAGINPGGTPNLDNNLLDIEINADADFAIGGTVVFNSTNADLSEATLTLEGPADVSIGALDVTDADIDVLNIVNNAGSLTITGTSPSIEANDTESIVISGTGSVVLGTAEAVEDFADGIDGGGELSEVDASGLTGDLSIENITGLDSANFSFVSGTGVTTLRISDSELNDDDAPAPEAGWSFDLSDAAPGSQLTFGSGLTFTNGDLNIDLGANAVLHITADTDWTALDNVSINGTIVLGVGVELTLTAAQASGLTIVADSSIIVDDSDPNFDAADVPQVSITQLGGAAYDFSGILAGVQDNIDPSTVLVANATLEDDDVTIHADADLGSVGITLVDIANGVAINDDLAGQTVRFNTAEQAERIIVVNGVDGARSTNVVWLFQTLVAPVDTSNYDSELARLWLTQTLANGANIEDLFTSLPDTIIRVDFANLDELEALLVSQAVNRTVELASFTNLPAGLIFNDQDVLEHVETLTIKMGGQVTVGDLEIDNIIDNSATYAGPVTFNSLTIESWLADDTGDLLAREGFDETVNQKPDSGNTFGDVSVGTDNNIDLLVVTVDTQNDEAGNDTTGLEGGANDVLTGTEITLGTITFDYDPTATVATAAATFTADGENNVTLKSLNSSDADIPTLNVVNSLSGAVLLVTGGSPAAAVDNTETLNIDAGAGSSTYLGHDLAGTVAMPVYELNGYAGVAGEDLSIVNITGPGFVNLGTIASIDGTDDDTSAPADGIADRDAFTLNGNGVLTSFARLGEAEVNGVATAPTLEAEQTWAFNGVSLTITEDVSFVPGATPAEDPTLALNTVELTIEGDVDLTRVNLTLTAVSIYVPAGNSLTLSLDQAEQLVADGVVVEGEGTVLLTGEVDTDSAVPADYTVVLTNIQTVGIDLSGLTNAGASPQVNDVVVAVNAAGAIDDAGDPAGFSLVGSPFNDDITGSNLGDTLDGAAGDDDLSGGDGDDTFLVTAGSDTIDDLTGEADDANPLTDEENDVLVVSAGATVTATSPTGFVATAATINNGTANLVGDAIDVSAAGGANGFNVTGTAADSALIGSARADVIVGGDGVDSVTGNGGADIFRFLTTTSTPLAVTQATPTPAEDWERIVVSADGGGFTGPGTLAIPYTVNNGATLSTIVVDVAAGALTADVATAIRVAFAAAGFTAVLLGADSVQVRGAPGTTLEVLPGIPSGTDAASAAAEAVPPNVDVAQVTTVTIGNGLDPVVVGEQYTLTVTLAGGQTFFSVTATATTTSADDVVTTLANKINDLGGAVLAGTAGNVLTLTDLVADNGGFTLVSATVGGFDGSTASSDVNNPATLDTVEDFAPGADKIDFQGLVAGTATNYAEAPEIDTYANALLAADAAIAGPVRYFLTSVAEAGVMDGDGVLFFDADADGVVDGAVRLVGVTDANFAFTDITASVAP